MTQSTPPIQRDADRAALVCLVIRRRVIGHSPKWRTAPHSTGIRPFHVVRANAHTRA